MLKGVGGFCFIIMLKMPFFSSLSLAKISMVQKNMEATQFYAVFTVQQVQIFMCKYCNFSCVSIETQKIGGGKDLDVQSSLLQEN